MDKDFIRIGDREYRVEVNWNCMVAYLKAIGKDTWEGLTAFSAVNPSDLAPLMAAAVNEGERLEGRPSSLTADDIGTMCGFETIGEFIGIYTRQSAAKNTPPDSKKKD